MKEFRLPIELESHDSPLRCTICKDFFNTPVSLKCGHSFCSPCIRSHFAFCRKQHQDILCPKCRQSSHEGDIRRVLDLRDVVHICQKYQTPEQESSEEVDFPAEVPPLVAAGVMTRARDRDSDALRLRENAQDGNQKGEVPPALHKSSVTRDQLMKYLKEWGLSPTQGSKDELWDRYQSFRLFVLTERDAGRRKKLTEMAEKFMKTQNLKSKSKADDFYSQSKLDLFLSKKTTTTQETLDEVPPKQ